MHILQSRFNFARMLSLTLSNMHASQRPNDFYGHNMKTSGFYYPECSLEFRLKLCRSCRPPDVELKSIKIDVQLGWFRIFTTHTENGVKTRPQVLIEAQIKSGGVGARSSHPIYIHTLGAISLLYPVIY